MIQRIQSVWLFLASMIAGALFMPSMVLYSFLIPKIPFNEPHFLKASNDYPLLAIAALMTILPLVTIFFFGNRKRQRGLVVLSMLACVSFLAILFMKVGTINNSTPKPISPQYGIIGALIPILSLIFLFLALRGIRKDDKLIKSLDRLR